MSYNHENAFKYLSYIDLHVEYIYHNACIYTIKMSQCNYKTLQVK